MQKQSQSESEPIVKIERGISVTLNLSEHCETAGTYDGINLFSDQGDGYVITPAQLREVAKVLLAVADEALGGNDVA
jgi:hypothetical protein